ncbi:hypothetical protein XENOCAPTIV_030405 [Xenoophorus captivus]|uniref:Uncharacterized protein n=1 Tax=Xenoophorus captivus TaxID=1517983 RepID=A0ABV0RWQ0_9TELE
MSSHGPFITSKLHPLKAADKINVFNLQQQFVKFSLFSVLLCSEKPLPLTVLLTDNQGDQSAAYQDLQATPLFTCLVKPLRTASDLPSDPTSSAASSSSGTDSRSPCSRFGKPLSNARSLPALSVDTCLNDLAPPPPPEEEWSSPSQALPPPGPCSQTSSPVDSNNRCHVMMVEDPCYTKNNQAPPPSSCPTRKWSCLNLNQPDDVDSPDLPVSSSFNSPSDSASSTPPVSQPIRTCSPSPSQVHRAALPVECWAENVNRYYSSQNAAGGGGGAAQAGEELSELETLYQASLQAPSMHRGSRGVNPQPGGSRPGEDENYSAENLRRLARSLSGTVIGSRPQNPPCSCVSLTKVLFWGAQCPSAWMFPLKPTGAVTWDTGLVSPSPPGTRGPFGASGPSSGQTGALLGALSSARSATSFLQTRDVLTARPVQLMWPDIVQAANSDRDVGRSMSEMFVELQPGAEDQRRPHLCS